MADDLVKAQQRFRAKHGPNETWRLYASIESIVHGAPIRYDNDPWRYEFVMGTAMSLYDGLARVDQLDVETFGEIIVKQQPNQVGTLGWGLLWNWRVAVLGWDTLSGFSLHSQCVHGSEYEKRDIQSFVGQYEIGMRMLVDQELRAYYFDHFEHTEDIKERMRILGYDFSCDAHGVGAYFGEVADMPSVRSLFDQMSSVPNNMTMDTFMHAVETAYSAANREGHGTDLRGFKGVKESITNRVERQNSGILLRTQDGSVSIEDTKHAVIAVVKLIHDHQNAMGVHMSDDELDRIVEKIKEAEPSIIIKLMKEWLPGAVVGVGVSAAIQNLWIYMA